MHYTIIERFRTVTGGPLDSVMLYGQPNISGIIGQNGYHVFKVPGTDKWMWVRFYTDSTDKTVNTGEMAKKLFDTQLAAMVDADGFQGRHVHISVIDGQKKPFFEQAQVSWEEFVTAKAQG